MGDNWTVMCGSGSWKRGEDVRFYHDETKAYLAASGKLKFGDPIPDQLQVSGSSWKNGNTIWRTNEGFYLAPPTSK